jgi:hypothetical protein
VLPKADIKGFTLELKEDQPEPLASFARHVATGMGACFVWLGMWVCACVLWGKGGLAGGYACTCVCACVFARLVVCV